jgi:hypothetical protein
VSDQRIDLLRDLDAALRVAAAPTLVKTPGGIAINFDRVFEPFRQ